MKQSTPVIFHIFSTVHISIYKEKNGRFIGTVPFYIGTKHITKPELYAFNNYHQGRPFIDKINIFQVPVDFIKILITQPLCKIHSKHTPKISIV